MSNIFAEALRKELQQDNWARFVQVDGCENCAAILSLNFSDGVRFRLLVQADINESSANNGLVSLWQMKLTDQKIINHMEDEVGIDDDRGHLAFAEYLRKALVAPASGPRVAPSMLPIIRNCHDDQSQLELIFEYRVGPMLLSGVFMFAVVQRGLDPAVFAMMRNVLLSSPACVPGPPNANVNESSGPSTASTITLSHTSLPSAPAVSSSAAIHSTASVDLGSIVAAPPSSAPTPGQHHNLTPSATPATSAATGPPTVPRAGEDETVRVAADAPLGARNEADDAPCPSIAVNAMCDAVGVDGPVLLFQAVPSPTPTTGAAGYSAYEIGELEQDSNPDARNTSAAGQGVDVLPLSQQSSRPTDCVGISPQPQLSQQSLSQQSHPLKVLLSQQQSHLQTRVGKKRKLGGVHMFSSKGIGKSKR